MIKWSRTFENFNYLCSASLLEEDSTGNESTENDLKVCVIPKYVTPVNGCMCNTSTRPNGLPYTIEVKLSSPISYNGSLSINDTKDISSSSIANIYYGGVIGGGYGGADPGPVEKINPYVGGIVPAATGDNLKWRGAPYSDIVSTTRYTLTNDLTTSCNFSTFSLNNVYKYLENKFPPSSGDIFSIPSEYGFRDSFKNSTQCKWAALFGGVDYFLVHQPQYKCSYMNWDRQYPIVAKPDGYVIANISSFAYEYRGQSVPIELNFPKGTTEYPFWGEPEWYRYSLPIWPDTPNFVYAAIDGTIGIAESGSCYVGAGSLIMAPCLDADTLNNTTLTSRIVNDTAYKYWNGTPNNGVVAGLPNINETPISHGVVYGWKNAYKDIPPNGTAIGVLCTLGLTNVPEQALHNSWVCPTHPNQVGKLGPRFLNGELTFWKEGGYYYEPVVDGELIESAYQNDPSNPLSSWYIWNNSFNSGSPKINWGATEKNNLYMHTDISLPIPLSGPPTAVAPSSAIQFPVALGPQYSQALCIGCTEPFGSVGWFAKGQPFGYYWELSVNNGYITLNLSGNLKPIHYGIDYSDAYSMPGGTPGPREGDDSILFGSNNTIADEFVAVVKAGNSSRQQMDFTATTPFFISNHQRYGFFNPFGTNENLPRRSTIVSFISYPPPLNQANPPRIPCDYNGWVKMYRVPGNYREPTTEIPYIVGPQYRNGQGPEFAYVYIGDSGL